MKVNGKYLAYILRHNPSAAGLTLDERGYADVAGLIEGISKTGRCIDLAVLEEIVASDNKQRFAFNDDHTKIRANQGHSINVDVEMQELTPPPVLYHGTAEKYLDSIKELGLQKRSRNYVHLSADYDTAVKVGARHGKAVVLKIDAEKMYNDGYKFLLSANGVWQTDYVPYRYVTEIV